MELSAGKLLVILLIILLLFGSDKLTDLARNLGRAVNEFKKGMREIDSTAPPAPRPPAEVAMHPPQPPASGGHDAHGGGH